MAEVARELRRPLMTDGAMAKRVYEEVLRRGLKLSKKAFLEIVLATNSDPHTVGSLLAQLEEGFGSSAQEDPVAKELARFAREYEEDIARFGSQRRAAPVTDAEDDDDPPPSSSWR